MDSLLYMQGRFKHDGPEDISHPLKAYYLYLSHVYIQMQILKATF